MAKKITPDIPMHAVFCESTRGSEFYYSCRFTGNMNNEFAQLHYKNGEWRVWGNDDEDFGKVLRSKIYRNRNLTPSKRNVKRLLKNVRDGYMAYFYQDVTSFASAISDAQRRRGYRHHQS